MTTCWASVLGGCNRKSQEHIVSRNIIKKLEVKNTISIFGAPWNECGVTHLNPSSLTSGILCRKHNQMLSEVDLEAGKLSTILNDIFIILIDKKYDKTNIEKKLNGK
ncbi:hypothetical protein GYA49_00465 [Candidatus Beckwithbacteria bacterium]|nr:hypothetical protein [Candidatus Beckwithbacteria bacterium]